MSKYRTVEYGCITTPANERLPLRLRKIKEDLEEIISRYHWEQMTRHSFLTATGLH